MKYIHHFFFSVFILFFCVSYVYADPAADLANLLNTAHSMKANFIQTTYNNHGKVTQKASGNMALQRPGKFRWNVIKPMPQLIIANKIKLWIYDADLQQVTIRRLDQSTSDAPALLLSDDQTSLSRHFTVKTLQKNSGRWFMLTPKKKEVFESIQLGFKNNQINEMQLQDNLGSRTVIQFSAVQNNISTPAALFIFQPSKKVDIIDETRKSR